MSPGVVFRPEAKAGVVFRPDTGAIEQLNETGAFILSCVEKGMTEAETAEAMALAFDASEPEAEADVGAFLAEMADAGVVIVRNPAD